MGSATTSTTTTLPGGTYALGDLTVTRFGYGAMQLAGPWVMGPPADHDGAIAVLREVVDLGITHIDTSDAYGPRVTNSLIREALHPYPDSLHIVTKVGATRDADGGWPTARRPEDLRQQVIDNLRALGVDTLDVVNMRMGDAEGPKPGSIAEASPRKLCRLSGSPNVVPMEPLACPVKLVVATGRPHCGLASSQRATTVRSNSGGS